MQAIAHFLHARRTLRALARARDFRVRAHGYEYQFQDSHRWTQRGSMSIEPAPSAAHWAVWDHRFAAALGESRPEPEQLFPDARYRLHWEPVEVPFHWLWPLLQRLERLTISSPLEGWPRTAQVWVASRTYCGTWRSPQRDHVHDLWLLRAEVSGEPLLANGRLRLWRAGADAERHAHAAWALPLAVFEHWLGGESEFPEAPPHLPPAGALETPAGVEPAWLVKLDEPSRLVAWSAEHGESAVLLEAAHYWATHPWPAED